jgi:hypothetical protein
MKQESGTSSKNSGDREVSKKFKVEGEIQCKIVIGELPIKREEQSRTPAGPKGPIILIQSIT